jgi:hypothetical protein
MLNVQFFGETRRFTKLKRIRIFSVNYLIITSALKELKTLIILPEIWFLYFFMYCFQIFFDLGSLQVSRSSNLSPIRCNGKTYTCVRH